MKHQVRIINFSITLGESLTEAEEEIAQLLDEDYEIVEATGYTVGQSGPHHGGAFVILVKAAAAGEGT